MHVGIPDATNKTGKDTYYYYYWLHGIKDMVSYIQSKEVKYTSLSNEEEKHLYASIEVLQFAKNLLGTFSQENNSLPKPDVLIWGGNEEVMAFSRSKDAYGEITETKKCYQLPNGDVVVDEFEIKVNKSIQELKAAYDYGTKKAEWGKNVYILDSDEEKLKYDNSKIRSYIKAYGNRAITDEIERKWEQTMGITIEKANEEYWGKSSTGGANSQSAKDLDFSDSDKEPKIDKDKDTIFEQPTRVSDKNEDGTEKIVDTVSDAINDAESFVTSGNSDGIIADGNLQEFSQNLYSILLSIGVVISVIIGVIIGVKLMLAPVQERAEAKKLLIPYIVGCVIVFGAFGIWKLIVTIMQGM